VACLNFKSRHHCSGFYAHAVICVLECDKLMFVNVFMISVKHIFKGIYIKYPAYRRILLAYPEIYESGFTLNSKDILKNFEHTTEFFSMSRL